MRAQGYRAAIQWLANNDDTEWTKEESPAPSVTACLVADIYGVPESRVLADLRHELALRGPQWK